jgi:hypothetical protein
MRDIPITSGEDVLMIIKAVLSTPNKKCILEDKKRYMVILEKSGN